MIEDDEMVIRVEAWLAANPSRRALPDDVRETLSDCAEFLADIDGDLARRCEECLRPDTGGHQEQGEGR